MRPAYIIIAVVAVVIIVSVIRLALKSRNHHFECPNCGEHFQPGFAKSFFTAHSLGGQYSIKCPKCGKTNMMTSKPGKK